MGEEVPGKARVRLRESLQRYFLAGLLVFLPVVITLWFLGWVIGLLDGLLDVFPAGVHPNTYLPFAIPGLGAIVTVTLILFLGILTRGVATRRFLAAWENIFVKIPIFRGIYPAVQKLVQTFLGQSQNSRQVVMIEYPRKGIYTVGFAMGFMAGAGKEARRSACQRLHPHNTQSDVGVLSSCANHRNIASQYDDGRSAQTHHFRRLDYSRG